MLVYFLNDFNVPARFLFMIQKRKTVKDASSVQY